MADLSSQIAEARSNGYSDPDIVQYLGTSRADLAPKLKEAQASGYAPGEILDYLKSAPPAQPVQPVAAQPAAVEAPGGLPSPDLVDQQTTVHANTLANIVLNRSRGQQPPSLEDINAQQLQTQINAPNSPAVPGWADRPLIPAPPIGEEGGPIATGITRAVAGFASGMTTPKNLGLLAGTWGLGDSVVALRSLGRLVSGGFSVSMLWQAAKQAPDLIKQIRAGDTEGAAKTITSMGLGAGMAGASALHAAKGSPKTAAPEASANSTGTEPYQPPAQEPAQPVAAPGAIPAGAVNFDARLPRELAGAKPRYSYGAKQFDLKFESDLDRGAYITAQAKRSASDARYLKFVMDATGRDEDAVRLHGGNVRAAIKQQAKGAEPGTLTVPDMARKRFAAVPQVTIESPGGSRGKQPTAAVDSGAAGPVDAGRTGEGPAVHGAPPPGPGPDARPGSGDATDVLIPGEDRSIPARYAIRELSDIQPSHNGQTFSANPKYQGQNERDYSKPENQQRVIQQSSEEKFEPRYHINDDPTMGNGPALIDEEGNALGGNSRTMHLQRVYGRDAQKAAEYRALLEKKAAQFGIDPEAVRGMRQPVLVRVATPEGLEALPGGSKWAVRKTNITGTAALSSSERAAADAGQMSPEMVGHIAGAIEDAGPDATLNDALAGRSGTAIVNRLIADGFFSEQERPALMDGKTGALTQAAKDRISKALLGKFFRDSDQISRTPASIRNKLERIAAPLSKVAGNPEWDITPDVREAVDLTEYAGAHGIRNLSDVVSQSAMFGEAPRWPDGAVKLAELLRDGKPNDVVSAFRRYVNSKEPNMFGESTPAEAFRAAFGAEKPERPGAGSPPEVPPTERASEAGFPEEPEIGPHGPIYREYSGRPREAIAKLVREQKGEVPRVWYHPELGWVDLIWGNENGGLAHIVAKHVERQKDLNLDDLAEMIPGMRVENNNGHTATLENASHEAAVRLDYDGNTKQWLVSAYEKKPPAGGYPVVPGSPPSAPRGDGHPPSDGSGSSVTLGSGLGAFEPFLRESVEDMRALKAARDAAIEELERSKITPGEKRWGEQVRHFFTATRDLWGARANQGIAKVRKLTYQYRDRRTGVDTSAEAMAIAREFKGNPDELKSILGGYHPDLARQQDPKVYDRVMSRILALRPVIERALAFNQGHMDPDMKAVDQFYTNMAEMTGIEGRRVGVHHSLWNPETYVPHVLNPKGEGQYPGLRKAVGRALGGQIGKYFGFEQERTYPTLLHAMMNDVIPKTMNVHDAFTIQQDHFARARATRLLEDQLRDTGVGKYSVSKLAPEGWKPLAAHDDEFQQLVPYDTGQIDAGGNAVLDTAEKRLYVPDFISDALKPITAPDYTVEIGGKDIMRGFQAATKAAQLGLSFFHATTENYMALANMGPKGWAKALMADRDSPEFLLAERDFIAHGGTTSIQGNTIEAYKAMKPGSIPTYQDIWRQNAVVKIMDQAAHAISDFTFANLQRRFKVTDYQLHKAAWMEKNPGAMRGEAREAGRGIAKEVNAVYGGLHWENIGINKATVEIARAVMLAPDWTISNIFNVKYAFEKGAAGNMARMFWMRTLVGGMVATQAASLMFSGHFSKRPTMAYMGKDVNGEDIYQNMFFKGAPGDAANLVSNVYDYGLEGIFRTMAGKGSPTVRTGLQLATNKDYLGHEIAPRGMNPLASSARTALSAAKSLAPIPLSLTNQVDMLFGPEAHKYTWPESLTTMFSGNPPSHVAPAGTHMSNGILMPNTPREENSVLDQAETGEVYRRRNAGR